MQLVERGLLNLDEPVQRYVSWFSLADKVAAASITARHLLTHTSGISRYAGRELLGGHRKGTIDRLSCDIAVKSVSPSVM
jgi:CubicO group peptidase (beta-lactamase class C family)